MVLSVPGLDRNFIARTRNGRRQNSFEVVIGSMSSSPIRHRPPQQTRRLFYPPRDTTVSQYFVKFGQIIQAREKQRNGLECTTCFAVCKSQWILLQFSTRGRDEMHIQVTSATYTQPTIKIKVFSEMSRRRFGGTHCPHLHFDSITVLSWRWRQYVPLGVGKFLPDEKAPC